MPDLNTSAIILTAVVTVFLCVIGWKAWRKVDAKEPAAFGAVVLMAMKKAESELEDLKQKADAAAEAYKSAAEDLAKVRAKVAGG